MQATDYRILHEKYKWVAATGFSSMEKALAWIGRFDPSLYVDKTLKRDDFVVQGMGDNYQWKTVAKFEGAANEN